jgi:hypothetical protein
VLQASTSPTARASPSYVLLPPFHIPIPHPHCPLLRSIKSQIGQNGTDLADKWKVCPEGYLGLAIPEFPNFLTFIGPNWPVENGSVMGPLNYVSLYTLQIIKKLQTEYIASLAPKQSVTDAFNEHCQEVSPIFAPPFPPPFFSTPT